MCLNSVILNSFALNFICGLGGSYDSTEALLDAVTAYQLSKTTSEHVEENLTIGTSAPTFKATDEAVEKVSKEPCKFFSHFAKSNLNFCIYTFPMIFCKWYNVFDMY